MYAPRIVGRLEDDPVGLRSSTRDRPRHLPSFPDCSPAPPSPPTSAPRARRRPRVLGAAPGPRAAFHVGGPSTAEALSSCAIASGTRGSQVGAAGLVTPSHGVPPLPLTAYARTRVRGEPATQIRCCERGRRLDQAPNRPTILGIWRTSDVKCSSPRHSVTPVIGTAPTIFTPSCKSEALQLLTFISTALNLINQQLSVIGPTALRER